MSFIIRVASPYFLLLLLHFFLLQSHIALGISENIGLKSGTNEEMTAGRRSQAGQSASPANTNFLRGKKRQEVGFHGHEKNVSEGSFGKTTEKIRSDLSSSVDFRGSQHAEKFDPNLEKFDLSRFDSDSIRSERKLKGLAKKSREKQHLRCAFHLPMPNLYQKTAASNAMKDWPYKWTPQPHRFLVLHCETGRMSNRVFCFLNALKYASILNRTLLLTLDPGQIRHGFHRRLVFDIEHVRQCYGINTIMTIEEYEETYGKRVVIDQVLCMNEMGCPIEDFSARVENYFPYWKRIDFSKSGPKPRVLENPACAFTIEELREVYGNVSGNILYMGKFLFNQLKSDDLFDVPILRSNECHSNIGVQPHWSVLDSGRKFVKEIFKGTNYMAIHLRREDFKEACEKYGDKKCYLPIEEVVECLNSKLLAFNISDVFLATNGNAEEMAYISENLGSKSPREVRFVQLKNTLTEDKEWAIPMLGTNVIFRDLFEAELDKVISMQSTVFVGSWRSTFTGDIERLRYGFGTSDPRDTFLCEEIPPSVSTFT